MVLQMMNASVVMEAKATYFMQILDPVAAPLLSCCMLNGRICDQT